MGLQGFYFTMQKCIAKKRLWVRPLKAKYGNIETSQRSAACT
jgi:hypothetical protein